MIRIKSTNLEMIFFGLFRSEGWWFITDVSAQLSGPILKVPVPKRTWIDYPETSVINYQYSLRNNTEESSFSLPRSQSLKSHKFMTCFNICKKKNCVMFSDSLQ